jgi:transposase-like protein
MKKISYGGYRFPPEIIQQAIWLYLRFTLSLRDVEDLLAERGITVSYESIRRWINLCVPNIRFCNIGGEGRRGSVVM